MWILQIPDVPDYKLKVKQLWLRPGTSVAVGRNPSNDVILDGARSISKHHISIDVDQNEEGFSSKVHKRSVLRIRDLGAKFKSFLSLPNADEAIQVESEYILQDSRVNLRLGKVMDAIFTIFWQEMTIALSNVKPKDVQALCDKLDVKYSKDYSPATTHVVTSKYNTPKALQALILQKWIVAPAYLTAMLEQAEQSRGDIGSMPDPWQVEYLPEDAFSEEYGHTAFRPTAGRENCYEGLQFVFFTPEQYKSLKPLITTGAGQSFLYQGDFSEQVIADYLFELSRPVVIPPVNSENETELLDQLVEVIGCVTMTQGDFIHLILSSGKHEVYDACKTRPWSAPKMKASTRSLSPEQSEEEEVAGAEEAEHNKEEEPKSVTEVVPQQHDTIQIQMPSLEEAELLKPAPSRRIGSRAVRTLESFDDDLFGTIMPLPKSSQGRGDGRSQGWKSTPETQAATQPFDLFESSMPMPPRRNRKSTQEVSEGPSLSQPQPVRSDRKRPHESEHNLSSSPEIVKKVKTRAIEPEYIEQEFQLPPAATAFEKTRSQVVERPPAQDKGNATRDDMGSPDAQANPRKRKQVHKDITEEEIRQTLLENKRKAEKELQAADEENGIPGNNELRNLGTVEFFELELRDDDADADDHTRHEAPSNATGVDPRWAGRKNFKRFRRAARGDAQTREADRPSIMIRLVESRPSDRAFADKQWLETATTRDASHSSRARNDERAANLEFGPIMSRESRGERTQSRGPSQRGLSQTQAPSQTQRSNTTTRAAQQSLPSKSRSQNSKPGGQSLFLPDESDSDDDPLKFRM